MVYVTEDVRVKLIVGQLRKGSITASQARVKIKAMPPRPGHHFGFLSWEIEEALNGAEAP